MTPRPATTPAKPLDPKRQRFVDEYLVDLNATQAAIRAGYSPKTANQQGSRLLTNVGVAAAIAARADERANRVQVNADTVLRELLRMATVDLADVFDDRNCLKNIRDIPEDARRAIASIEVEEVFEGKGEGRQLRGYVKKVKFWDKKGANDSLGKHLKLFVDRLEMDASDSLAALIAKAGKRE